MIAVKRIGSAGVAVLALVVGVGMSPAHAENPPGVDYSGPQSNPQVVYPEPVEVLYSVGTNDGAVSTKQKKDTTITTLSGDVNFEVDSDQLTARAREILDSLASEWSKTKPSTVSVTGHTDSVADDAHNLDLSKRRAKAVGDYLASKVPGLSITTDGKGEAEPIADNETDEGRAQNRRVEIRAQK